MARAPAAELTKTPDVVERHRWIAERLVFRIDGAHAGQVQHRARHRGMPDRQDEPIAVRPDRMCRIEPQDALPEAAAPRRERHRGAGMPGVRLLHGVHRQGADGVDAQLIHLGTRGTRGRCRLHENLCAAISCSSFSKLRILQPTRLTVSQPSECHESERPASGAPLGIRGALPTHCISRATPTP